MKNIRDLTGKIEILSVSGPETVMVGSVEFDSRAVKPGTLFIAVKGTKTDGHDFIDEAIRAGASAIICERMPPGPDKKICWIVTPDSAKALGIVASEFFGNPSASLKLTGVTGTNGKTTVATVLYRIFSGLGYKCGLFSTVCNYVADKEYPATLTTPDPIALNRTLAEMVEAGCEFTFMEVSSHAAHQKRIGGLKYAGGIFTNLTHDHLDYHLTFDNYLRAKKAFFDSLPADAFALVNVDDKNGRTMIQNCPARHYTFSLKSIADYRAKVIEEDFGGMLMKIQDEDLWVMFTGFFNAYNILAAFAASEILGAPVEKILTVLSSLGPVPGRLEAVESPGKISGIVDYAHTPDALLNVIATINKIRGKERKLITVVGAGGDRDRTKRPRMARICAEGSSKVILTSDNPRTENPERILDDMEAGLTGETRRKVVRITGRREAIRAAVMMAEEGDVILVAGKGHEPYQEINGVRYHFDDREELKEALRSRYNG